jgi:hypothetical protein
MGTTITKRVTSDRLVEITDLIHEWISRLFEQLLAESITFKWMFTLIIVERGCFLIKSVFRVNMKL